MKSAKVVGRFRDEAGNPVEGRIEFIPSRLWVTKDDVSYATLSHAQDLVDGRFEAELTPTHGHDDFPWHYTVICPVGRWTIKIEETDQVIFLRDLLPSRFR